MKKLNVVILAAGKGERMISKRPKVMHEIMGRPMIRYVVERARELSPAKIVVVVGHGREEVEEYLKAYPVACVLQREQKGTAHALLSAGRFIDKGDVLVLYGDVPMIEKETLKDFLSFYEKAKSVTFMTTDVPDPGGYGRVIMSGDEIIEIKEDADATRKEREIKRINTGICIIPARSFPLLRSISADNKKGEYYLTDICKVGRQKGQIIKGYNHGNSQEVLGINSRMELLEANRIMRWRIVQQHMRRGVTFLDKNVYIESGVKVGIDTTIFPNCYLLGDTVIGSGVVIGPNVVVKDSVVHDNVTVEGFAVVEGSEIKKNAKVGPFSRTGRAAGDGEGRKKR